MKRRLITVIAALLTVAALAAVPAAANDTQTITDMAGRNVTIPVNPERIVCLSPGTLRLIVYLQAQDLVVAIEDLETKFPMNRPYYFAHPELSKLPSAGPGGPNSINKEPDYEKLLAAAPEVIFATYMEPVLADRVQEKIGIPVVVLTYGPFGTFTDKAYDSIMLAGRVLGREARAKAVVDYIKAAKEDLQNRVAGIPEDQKPVAYIGGIGFKAVQGIESSETMYPPLAWVAAKNAVAGEGSKGHCFIDKERLLELDPDIIFIDGGGAEMVRQDYEKKADFYQGLKAFKDKKVYVLHSYNWYMTNLGTVISDAYAAGKIVYPERFADVDPAKRADEVYEFLVGRPVYADMMKTQGALGQAPPYVD